MQFVFEMVGSHHVREGQETVYRNNTMDRVVGYEISDAGRIDISESETPVYRHVNITIASQADVLPAPCDLGDYTVTVTVDIEPKVP